MKHLNNMRFPGLVMALLTCFQISAMAAGFQVYLPSSRATAMGNLGVGLRPDASSIYVNPGAMALMENNQIMMGFNFIEAKVQFYNSQVENSNYVADSDNPTGTPFHAYAVWGPREAKWKVGLGMYTPYGSRVNWGDEWQGRFLLTGIRLQAIYIQPTFSYAFSENFSIGAGLIGMFGNVDLKRVIDTSSDLPPTTINLVGDAEFAFGFNVGLYWAISEKWQLGASYRSKVDATLKGGDVSFENVPSSLSTLLTDNKFSSTIPLPSSANLALNWTPDENWEVGVEVNYIGWSAYKSLDFDFEDENPVIQDSESPRNYEDSWVFHLGGEYDFGKFQLRAGGYYDLTPVQEGYMTPETPDANRIAFTGGLGYSLGDFLQFDLAFLFIAGQEREQLTSVAQSVGTYPSSTNSTYAVEPGTYKMRAYIPDVTITYKF